MVNSVVHFDILGGHIGNDSIPDTVSGTIGAEPPWSSAPQTTTDASCAANTNPTAVTCSMVNYP